MDFENEINEHINGMKNTISTQFENIKIISNMIISTIDSGNKILIAGNGGSAADAQHVAAEFTNRFEEGLRRPLPMISLSTDTSVITAIGNDYSFNQIFSKQIEAVGFPGDLFIGISTSGNSQNIIEAFEMCKNKCLTTILFTGLNGENSFANELANISFIAQSQRTAIIQEIHIFIWHVICKIIDNNYKQVEV